MSSLNKDILRIGIPAIVANITTPLLSLVDTAITGHMGSAVYIGAIAVGGLMFNMIYWLFGFLRTGASGLAAQAYGADDTRAQTLTLYRSLGVGVLIGLALVALQNPLLWLMQKIIAADPQTAVFAAQYFRILIYGAPAVLATHALSGWFLGMQNSRMLMGTSLVINIINILVSVGLVLGLGWQVPGVAVGTLTAQWAGLGAGLWFLRRYRLARVSRRDVFEPKPLRRFFVVNRDMMLRGLCFIVMTTWFTKAGAAQGAVVLAANTVLMQFFYFFSYLADGFAFSAEALAGKFLGAADYRSLRRCVRIVMRWGAGLAVSVTLVYLLFGNAIVALLTDEETVRAVAAVFLPWAALTPLAGFAAFMWDGVFVGTTLSRQLVITMLIALAVFLGLYLLWPQGGNRALWTAFLAFLATRGLVQTLLFRRKYPAQQKI